MARSKIQSTSSVASGWSQSTNAYSVVSRTSRRSTRSVAGRVFCNVRNILLLTSLAMMAFFAIFGKDLHNEVSPDVDYEQVTHSSLLERVQSRKGAAKELLRKSVSGGLGKVDHALHAMEEKVLEWKDRLDDHDHKTDAPGDGEKAPPLRTNTEDSGVAKLQPKQADGEGEMSSLFLGRQSDYRDHLELVNWNLPDAVLSKRMQKAAEDPSVVNKGVIDGHEFYWQYPTQNQKDPKKNFPSAILVLVHACRRAATDWFTSLSGERAPEETAIVDIARQKGMMVIAVTPKNQRTECFDRLDGPRVASILRHVEKRQSVIFSPFSTKGHVPMYAFGSQRGAMFISSALPRALEKLKKDGEERIPLDGMVLQNVGARLNKNIPSVFITTPNEEKLHEELDLALEDYDGPVQHIELSPVLMSPSHLSDRVPSLSMEASTKFFERLGEEKLLNDDQTGLLSVRSLANDAILLKLVKQLTKDYDLNINQASAIFDALAVSWGHHAITRDGVNEALDWLLIQKVQQAERR